MYKSILYLITILLLSSFGVGQNKQIEKKIDEFLSKQFNQADPGCVVLAAKEGKIIYRKAFGGADLQLNVPLNADMVFNIASITNSLLLLPFFNWLNRGKFQFRTAYKNLSPVILGKATLSLSKTCLRIPPASGIICRSITRLHFWKDGILSPGN